MPRFLLRLRQVTLDRKNPPFPKTHETTISRLTRFSSGAGLSPTQPHQGSAFGDSRWHVVVFAFSTGLRLCIPGRFFRSRATTRSSTLGARKARVIRSSS